MENRLEFKDYYAKPENATFIDKYSYTLYHSSRSWYVKLFFELEDFKQEVLLNLIKYWDYYKEGKFLKNSEQFVKQVIFRTVTKIYEYLDTDKNKSNYNLENSSLDNEEISIDIEYKHSFDFTMYLKELEKRIDNHNHYLICKMYLEGFTINDTMNALNVSKRKVEYTYKVKYRKIMIDTFLDIECMI